MPCVRDVAQLWCKISMPGSPPSSPLSCNHDLAKAINYMRRRWPAFTNFLDDGRVCITNNAA